MHHHRQSLLCTFRNHCPTRALGRLRQPFSLRLVCYVWQIKVRNAVITGNAVLLPCCLMNITGGVSCKLASYLFQFGKESKKLWNVSGNGGLCKRLKSQKHPTSSSFIQSTRQLAADTSYNYIWKISKTVKVESSSFSHNFFNGRSYWAVTPKWPNYFSHLSQTSFVLTLLFWFHNLTIFIT